MNLSEILWKNWENWSSGGVAAQMLDAVSEKERNALKNWFHLAQENGTDTNEKAVLDLATWCMFGADALNYLNRSDSDRRIASMASELNTAPSVLRNLLSTVDRLQAELTGFANTEASTLGQYDDVMSRCRMLYFRKLKDYGPSWLIFRLTSLTDQLLIKALRIRSLEQKKDQSLILEGREAEYQGIINYGVIALMMIWRADDLPNEFEIFSRISETKPDNLQRLIDAYDSVARRVRELFIRKNHDYGEAWKSMRASSITDQILVKLARLRQIESNFGNVTVSEGVDAQISDIVNYAVFGMIKVSMS